MKKISIVVPMYNEEEMIPLFFETANNVIKNLDNKYKVSFTCVDDGSKDRTLDLLKKQRKIQSNIRIISFSRNFGHEAAVCAGLKQSNGDIIIVMDADLQDPPEVILQLIKKYEEGYDVVNAKRINREKDPFLKKITAEGFYSIINKISQTEIVDGAQDFRFMNRKMVDSILQMSEYNRFSKGIFSWVGYKTKYIEYENVERAAGTTAWSFWKLFLYSIEGIVAFSTAPLSVPVVLGSLESFAGLVLLIVGIVRTCMVTASQAAWILAGLIAGFIGLTTICIGVLGVYMSKIYMEVKNRPIYLVSETEKDIQK